MKSASLSPFKRFAFELRDIVYRQPLPGYRLAVEREVRGRELLAFISTSLSTGTCEQPVEALVLSGTTGHVLSGTGGSCYQEPGATFSSTRSAPCGPPSLESNRQESNLLSVGGDRGQWKAAGGER